MMTIVASIAAIILGVQNENITSMNDLVKYYKEHNDLKDIEYIYEGTMYDISKGKSNVMQQYSGNYVLRIWDEKNNFTEDTYIDVYSKSSDDNASLSHLTMTAIKGESQIFTHPPFDRPAPKNVVTKKARSSGNFRKFYSPELTINAFTWWQLIKPQSRTLSEYDVVGVQHDEADGDLLLVTRDPNRNSGKAAKTPLQYRFYLSPIHGYQVKKYEKYQGGRKIEQIIIKDFIKLKIINSHNKFIDIWHPLATEYHSFFDETSPNKGDGEVMCVTTILKDTIKVNQNLSDDRFSVFYAQTSNQKSQLDRLKGEFNYEKIFTKKDSKSEMYREALEQQLAAVNAQSTEISFAKDEGSWLNLLVNRWVLATILLITVVSVQLVSRRSTIFRRPPRN